MLGIALRHFDIAEFLHQVDMSHLLPAFDMVVEELHDLAGIEAVLLAEIDEEPSVSGLRATFATCAVAFFLAVAVASLTFFCRWFHDFRRILVIVEESPEGHAHHLLDDVFLVDILKLVVDVGHVWCDKFLVDICLHDLVHLLEELLLAYFLSRGQCAVDKFLANHLLDVAHLVLLPGVYDGYRGALLARATRSSRPVGIVFNIVGQSVVDDMCQVVHVQSAGGHVGRHEDLREVVPEFLHRQVTLLLREVAVQ